jgi:hypothetical protein
VNLAPGLATVRPRYGEASLADILPAALATFGVPDASDRIGLPPGIGGPDGPRVIVVLLLDGFGHELLPAAAPSAPAIADLAAGRLDGGAGRAITAGFPTTTPVSLASLGTGAAPGAHGLIGFFLNVPGTDRVLDHLLWIDEPDPLRWQPLPTLFDRARAAGVAPHVVSHPNFRGSGLTRATWRGADYTPATDADALAVGILHLVHQAVGPTIVYGYLPDVDKAGHIAGIESPLWIDAVGVADRLVTRLIEGLPRDAALLVTADHGQVNVPDDRRFDIAADARLSAGLRVVAGEARVRYLHTRPGARDDVLAAWQAVLGDAAWVVAREEAVAQGWFGPVSEAHLERVGDVVAVCNDNYAVLNSGPEPGQIALNVAFHGSATADEMMIPLLTYRRP